MTLDLLEAGLSLYTGSLKNSFTMFASFIPPDGNGQSKSLDNAMSKANQPHAHFT